MVDRAGVSNELFRFSTTTLQWEQLDADLVSGSPPSARSQHAMAAVGSDLFVFGGDVYQYLVDRPGVPVRSNDLFRFSTTALQWEQLDEDLVSGSPPSARDYHTMAVVGSDLIVFGGSTDSGEEACCACWQPSGVMSDIAPTIVPRASAVRARLHGLEGGFRVCHHPGLVVTLGSVHQLYTGTVRLSEDTTDDHVHNVASRATWCTGGAV